MSHKKKKNLLDPNRPSGEGEFTQKPVQWRQARYTWKKDGRAVQTGYFNYDFQQDAKTVGIEITK